MSSEVSILAAFSAGFLSFFAPCILPLIPPYFAWLLGIREYELGRGRGRFKLFLHSLILVIGFSLIFIILGASASKIGQALSSYRLVLQKIGGLIIIILGLEFIGIFKLIKDRRNKIIKKLFSGFNRKTSSLLVGFTFAFAWIACFSPILGSILVLSSLEETLFSGVILLIFYSIGLAIPFLISSLCLNFLINKVNFFTIISKWINLISGLILIILGILLATDNYYKIVAWFTKALN